MEFQEQMDTGRQSRQEEAKEILAILENARRRGIRKMILRRSFIAAVFLAGAIVGGLLVSYYPELLQTVQAYRS